MCGSRGGGGSAHHPLEKHKLYGFLVKLAFGPPPPLKNLDPLENVGPPLDPWKRIVFFVIKALGPP